jgi:hypothetical protein
VGGNRCPLCACWPARSLGREWPGRHGDERTRQLSLNVTVVVPCAAWMTVHLQARERTHQSVSSRAPYAFALTLGSLRPPPTIAASSRRAITFVLANPVNSPRSSKSSLTSRLSKKPARHTPTANRGRVGECKGAQRPQKQKSFLSPMSGGSGQAVPIATRSQEACRQSTAQQRDLPSIPCSLKASVCCGS